MLGIVKKIKKLIAPGRTDNSTRRDPERSREEHHPKRDDRRQQPQRKNDRQHPAAKKRRKAHKSPPHAPKGTHHAPRSQAIPPMPEIREVKAEEGKLRFTELDIDKRILAALQDIKFEYCTPIQEKALPTSLSGKDLAGKAQTGTGKTAAFLIAAYNHILLNPLNKRLPGTPRALIMAPTRELAIQIFRDAEAIGKYSGLNNLVVFGGMDHKKQQDALRKPIDILIGTPGRLFDYIRSSHLILSRAEILVIDEADRMLDMGFIPDVRRIVSRLPAAGKRQTMFYSATLTQEVLRLVNTWLHNPDMIEIEPEQLVTDLVEQRFVSVTSEDKLAMLLSILKNEKVSRMLVFVNRRDVSMKLRDSMRDYGVNCAVLSGEVPQNKRIRILEDFRQGRTPVIVATDVAARGIHVDDISHVINYDLPHKPEDYVHRIGRTGRAGEKGKSISFVCEYGAYTMQDIEELLGNPIKTEIPDESSLKLPERKHGQKRPTSNSQRSTSKRKGKGSHPRGSDKR